MCAWRRQAAVDEMLLAHEAACLADAPPPSDLSCLDPDAAPAPRRAGAAALSQAAKSALSLELDCGETAGRLLTALRAERWRGRVHDALHAHPKPTGAARQFRLWGVF